jgi:hypothetical protein
MRIFIVAVMIAVLTVPAYSQIGGGMGGGGGGGMGGGGIGGGGGGLGRVGSGGGGKGKAETAADAAKKKAEDKAFADAIKKIPAPEKKFDPWGGVREVRTR